MGIKKTSATRMKQRPKQKRMKKIQKIDLLLFEVFLDVVGGDDFLFEHVGAGLLGADHADHLGKTLAGGGFEGSNNFLCHILMSPIVLLLDFFVDGHFLQEGVVLLELEALRGVLLVLGGDIAAHAGDTAGFLLGALQDDLNACVFSFLCHDYICFFISQLVEYQGRKSITIVSRGIQIGCKITTFFSTGKTFCRKLKKKSYICSLRIQGRSAAII